MNKKAFSFSSAQFEDRCALVGLTTNCGLGLLVGIGYLAAGGMWSPRHLLLSVGFIIGTIPLFGLVMRAIHGHLNRALLTALHKNPADIDQLPAEELDAARRCIVGVPYRAFLSSLLIWLFFAPPAFYLYFKVAGLPNLDPLSLFTDSLMIVPVTSIVSGLTFELAFRPLVRDFFPRGGAESYRPRFSLTVQKRLMVLFFLIMYCGLGLFPFVLYRTVEHATSLESALQRLKEVIGFSLLTSLSIAALLVYYARTGISNPLTSLLAAMTGGDKQALLPVDSVDDVGLLADRINSELLTKQVLRASEHKIRSIMQTMPVAVITIDGGGVIESVNSAAEQMFAGAAGSFVGKPVQVILPAIDSHFWRRAVADDLFEKMVESEGLRANGHGFPVELAARPLESADSERFLLIALDISERRVVEQMKQEFVAMISHDLRTPLTALRGFLMLLRNNVYGELTDSGALQVKRAQDNVEQLIQLINDLLDLDKLEAGKLELELQSISLPQVAERAVHAVSTLAEKRSIEIKLELQDAIVVADQDRIWQVILNLLGNAVKYSPELGTVTVSTTLIDGAARLTVSDHGRGIPDQLREKIFDRFQQVTISDAKEKGGSGLGLAICKAIIEQHGGKIGVDSEPGAGSSFWFELPCQRAQKETERESSGAVTTS